MSESPGKKKDPLIVHSLEFLGGMASPVGWRPDATLPEVAFAGRSNVGKSSLINKLLRRSKAARVSNTPGRTREINFFRVNDQFVLVDLPGYGYAKVSKSKKAEWKPMIEGYLRGREKLRGIVQLLDIRHDPTDEDIQMLDFLSEVGVPTMIVMTKTDKLTKAQAATRIAAIVSSLGLDEEQVIPFSAVTGLGRDDLAEAVMSLVSTPKQQTPRIRSGKARKNRSQRPMPMRPLRSLEGPRIQTAATEWLSQIESTLADPAADRSLLCRNTLTALTFPEYSGNWESAVEDKKIPVATRLALASTDPRNITLEPEYYADCNDEKFQKNKPLLWLWYSFDRTVAGAQNVWLGIELRRILAKHIFKRVGANFKCFHNVEFSFGYNLEVGDNVVVHRHVLLDDRGGIVIGNNVSISDYANIYSHTHSIVEQKDVTNATTRLDDGVRITYHATVLAGVHVKEQRDGRRDGGGDQGRPAVSRLRRHSGEERAGEAECAAGGRADSEDERRAAGDLTQ